MKHCQALLGSNAGAVGDCIGVESPCGDAKPLIGDNIVSSVVPSRHNTVVQANCEEPMEGTPTVRKHTFLCKHACELCGFVVV